MPYKRIRGIYLITNVQNSKVYVGSSINIKARWDIHLKHLRTGKHGNHYLQRSYNKYSEEAFKFEIIEEVDCVDRDDTLYDREQYWLDYYRELLGRENVYNMGEIAKSPNRGRHPSEEAIEKYRESSRNRVWTDEARANISKGLTGRKLSEEHKKKIGINSRNRPKESNERAGRKNKEHYNDPEFYENCRIKSCKTWEGIISPTGEIYSPIEDLKTFCECFDLNYLAILHVLSGEKKAHRGWRSVTNPDIEEELPFYTFEHTDGTVEEFTNIAVFCRKYNIKHENIRAIIKGKQKTCKGWRLIKVETKMVDKSLYYDNCKDKGS
jgi:group I intron endonuclease